MTTKREQAVRRVQTASAEEAQRVYDEEYVPAALAHMRAEARDADVLVSTVGSQPYSVAMSLCRTRAAKVFLLCTEESLSRGRAAVELAGLPPEIVTEFRLVHRENPSDVYREVRAIARAHPQQRIVIDFTSGTKPMVAGASTAAGYFGFDQMYIESEILRSTPRLHGLEKAHVVEHPLHVFGDDTREAAERDFDAGRYEIAEAGFQQLGDALVPGYHHHARTSLCQAYAAWVRLDFGAARGGLTRTVDLLRKARRENLREEPLMAAQGRLARQVDAVTRLQEATKPDGEPACDVELASTLIRFLLAESHRRAESDASLAALLLTRALELGVQRALARHGIEAAAAVYDHLRIPRAELLGRFNEIAEGHGVKELPTTLALAQGRTLLLALGDESARGGMTKQDFNALLQHRNLSIFAHGKSPVSSKALATLTKGVRKLLTSLTEPDARAIPWPRDTHDRAYDPEFCLIRFADLPR